MAEYDEAFFVDRRRENVTWLYYNPDSNAGGQYVINEVSFGLIHRAAAFKDNPEEFFSFLEENCRQYLADIDTDIFQDYDEMFNGNPDITDLSEDSMNRLIDIAGKSRFAPVYGAKHMSERGESR